MSMRFTLDGESFELTPEIVRSASTVTYPRAFVTIGSKLMALVGLSSR